MRFLNSNSWLHLLTVWMVTACWSKGLSATERPVTPGVLVRDQFPWSFTRAAMTNAPRSVVVPLARQLLLHVQPDSEVMLVSGDPALRAGSARGPFGLKIAIEFSLS